MQEHDERFLGEMSEKAAGFYPGLSDRIHELSYQGLGRDIVIGGSLGHPIKLVGYILPLNFEQSRHILMFKSGLIIVTEPNPKTLITNPDLYKAEFSPSREPLILNWDSNLQRGIYDLYSGLLFKGQSVVLRSDNPTEKEQIKQALARAFSFAEELKREKDAAQREIADELIISLDRLLNPPKEDPK